MLKDYGESQSYRDMQHVIKILNNIIYFSEKLFYETECNIVCELQCKIMFNQKELARMVNTIDFAYSSDRRNKNA